MQYSVAVVAIVESPVTCVKMVSTQKSNYISRFRQALGQVRPPIGHVSGLDKIPLIQSEMASKKG